MAIYILLSIDILLYIYLCTYIYIQSLFENTRKSINQCVEEIHIYVSIIVGLVDVLRMYTMYYYIYIVMKIHCFTYTSELILHVLIVSILFV